MVRLTKIYTRGGDGGETSLGDGQRVAKYAPRVDAFGTVDEANAMLGLVRLHADAALDAVLSRIQNDLFDLGADLCMPTNPKDYEPLRIVAAQVTWIEKQIDLHNADLAPLDSFILPAGKPAVAFLHAARTVVRRAERLVTQLAATETVGPEVVKYLNRLSDLLFVLARHQADKGAGDVLWVPGKNR